MQGTDERPVTTELDEDSFVETQSDEVQRSCDLLRAALASYLRTLSYELETLNLLMHLPSYQVDP